MFDEENVLSDKQKGNLMHICKRFIEMAEIVSRTPFDPKISVHLKMAADLADEQVTLGKYYGWPEDKDDKGPGYKFLEQDDTVEKENTTKKSEPQQKVEPTPDNGKFSDTDIHGWLDGKED